MCIYMYYIYIYIYLYTLYVWFVCLFADVWVEVTNATILATRGEKRRHLFVPFPVTGSRCQSFKVLGAREAHP